MAASHDLHDALHLAVAAYDRIECAVRRQLGKVAAKALKQRAFVIRRALGHARERIWIGATDVTHACGLATVVRFLLGAIRDKLVNGVAHRVARDAHAPECLHGTTISLVHDAEQQMLGGDVGLPMVHHLSIGPLEHPLRAWCKGNVATRRGLAVVLGKAAYGRNGLVVGDVELGKRLRGDALAFLDERKQQVLGADEHAPEVSCLVLRKVHHPTRLVGKLFKHIGSLFPLAAKARPRLV